MSSWTGAWLLTLAVEVPLVAVCFPGRRGRLAIAAAAATTMTHVAMHASSLPGLAPPLGLLAAELGAVAVEALVYARVAGRGIRRRAWLAAAVANAASYVLGLAL